MAKYVDLESWDEFSSEMEQVPFFSKAKPLAIWIDYYLWKGGKSLEIERKIKAKAKELSHGGYGFPGNLFNSKGKPQERKFLGHIAARVIDENLLVEIEGKSIDFSINELSLDEKKKKNVYFANLFKQNAYIRIEGFREKRRPDSPDDSGITSHHFFKNYLPDKTDVELAASQIPLGLKGNIDAILDQIKKNVLADGKKLKDNWRIITERNIKENWFK